VADGARAVDLNVTGVLNGPGGLTKIGSGLMALTGANTYAGATAVNAGTFLLNGSITGAATSTPAARSQAAAPPARCPSRAARWPRAMASAL
jgi:autotransporter-associated beta strand protein